MHRQAIIPHESPADRTGEKHEGGSGLLEEAAGSPSGVCPHLGVGGGARVGRQMGGRGDGGEEHSWPEKVRVCGGMYVIHVMPADTGECTRGSANTCCMCANT